MSEIKKQMQMRYDTAARWETVDPVLLPGELAITTDIVPNPIKVGDGEKRWTELEYSTNGKLADSSGVINMYGQINGRNPDTQIIAGKIGNIWMGMLDGYNEPLIGFSHNRMAFLTHKGGTVSASILPQNGSNYENLFDGSGNGVSWYNTSNSVPIAITIDLPDYWSYMRELMIQWTGDYFPTSFLIEYSKDTGATWTTGFDITNWNQNWFCGATLYEWYGTDQIRITARAFNSTENIYDIAELGWTFYETPIDSYSLSIRDGGNVYGNINLPANAHFTIGGVSSTQANINASGAKTEPVAEDTIPIMDSGESYGLKKVTIANLRSALFIAGLAVPAVTAEPDTPASGGILYEENGAMKYKKADGTVATIVT